MRIINQSFNQQYHSMIQLSRSISAEAVPTVPNHMFLRTGKGISSSNKRFQHVPLFSNHYYVHLQLTARHIQKFSYLLVCLSCLYLFAYLNIHRRRYHPVGNAAMNNNQHSYMMRYPSPTKFQSKQVRKVCGKWA